MFSDQSMYEAKVLLRAVADAQETMKQAVQQQSQLERYTASANSLQRAFSLGGVKQNGESLVQDKAFTDLKEVKLFQFANSIISKYFGSLEHSKDYPALKKNLNDGISKLSSDQ